MKTVQPWSTVPVTGAQHAAWMAEARREEWTLCVLHDKGTRRTWLRGVRAGITYDLKQCCRFWWDSDDYFHAHWDTAHSSK